MDRYRGALLGLAAGDALGTTLEFSTPGTFEPIDDMTGGGPFQLKAGEWTDDTSMALCLAESLIECRTFDAADQMDRYLRWFRDGHLSSNGRCFDIGNTVRAALECYEQTGNPYAGSTDAGAAGNGSLMRLAPVALAFARHPETAIERAAAMSRTTHAADEAVDACRYYAGLIAGALRGAGKAEITGPLFHPVRGRWPEGALSPAVEAVAGGSFLERSPPAIRGTGYVIESLEAALWAFATTGDFRSGALAAVNLGDDADTTGAVYGQLAGAYYGVDAIPEAWRGKLAMADTIVAMADRLLDLSRDIEPTGSAS